MTISLNGFNFYQRNI